MHLKLYLIKQLYSNAEINMLLYLQRGVRSMDIAILILCFIGSILPIARCWC